MNETSPNLLTLAEQADLIARRELSPVELLNATLAQIDRLQPTVNAYISVLRDEATRAARETEAEIAAGRRRGPLHGVPVALKDLLHMAGTVTTAGSAILRHNVSTEDAEVVRRLKQAGAVIVGKNNLHEFAYGSTNVNPHYGNVPNPWDPERIPAGSSGGSAAAVATRMASGALGSDTGGSIRMPAALCGIVGLKPTYGRVSRHGSIPCAWSLDNIGPMCRTALDAALLLGVIAGHDAKDPASSAEPVPDYAAQLDGNIAGMRLGVLKEYVEAPTDPEVGAAFDEVLAVLRGLGAAVSVVSIPEVRYAIAASTAIQSAECATYHEETLRARAEEYGADIRLRLEAGQMVSATDYLRGQRVRRMLIERFRAVFGEVDALLCPTVPIGAPRFDESMVEVAGQMEPQNSALVRHTRLFNLVSCPAASVPCGFTSAGLPIGVQIAAAPFAEGTLLKIADAYQRQTDWHKRLPPLAR